MRLLQLFCFIFLVTDAGAQQKIRFPKGASLVTVFLYSGQQHRGILKHADESGLTISDVVKPGQTEQFIPEEIYRLETRKVNAVQRNALIGAGIGFMAGFAVGWNEYESGTGTNVNQLGHAAGAGLLGAFAGGFIGFISGRVTKTFYVLGRAERFQAILPKLNKYNPVSLNEN
jgi:hypothetical protein